MNLGSLQARWIEFQSKDYYQTLSLRNSVLRKPIGLQFSKDQLSNEIDDFHLGIFLSNECIACLVISKLIDSKCAKMRQVAVMSKFQGMGIGKLMIIETERRLQNDGFQSIELNARESAIPFYLSLGYSLVGEWFTEVGIPHKKMLKAIKLP